MNSSQRMDAVQNPIIPLIGELARNHPGTISFGQGVAFYDPPDQAFIAAQNCLSNPVINRYGPVEGIPELQIALQNKLHATNKINIHNDNRIVVTAGSNMAFNTAVLAITDPGDEVILPLPYYFNHEMSLTMENVKPVLIDTTDIFHLNLDTIESAITTQTKAIVTISPNNPSGAVYAKEELVAVNNLCRKYGIYHVSDEAYEDFYYEPHSHYSVASDENVCGHTISLFSFSKGFGFAGWRIGYMVIPSHLLGAVKKIQDTILISPPLISQYAAIGALDTGFSFLQDKRAHMEKKRNLVLESLSDFTCLKSKPTSEGAFYVLISTETNKDDLEICKELIAKFGVATIPGSAFGIDHGCYLRLSYGALSDDSIDIGLERLKAGLSKLCV